jgi:hypothetical protein
MLRRTKGCDFCIYGKRGNRFSRISARVVHGRRPRNDLREKEARQQNVGQDRISYDINTHGGCSEAIVFLLDTKQADSVSTQDYGRAIAIHSGPCPERDSSNMAFLLSTSG